MLTLNTNVMKARTILGMVSAHTFVDSSLLLDDNEFGRLLNEYSHNETVAKSVVELVNYVNSNY